MLISTPEELRLCLPTHQLTEDISMLSGFLETSEKDFVLPVLGNELYVEVQKKYDEIADPTLLSDVKSELRKDPWVRLILACQRPLVFNACYRSEGILNSVISGAGLNMIGTENFDPASEKFAERFRTTCNREAHQGIDLLLRLLEDDATGTKVFTELWKKSRYYYRVSGRLINTADEFNQYVNIYGSREKFISLVQDIAFCEDTVIRPEVGDDYLMKLIERMNAGKLNTTEKTAVGKLQKALALLVETRNKMFSRPESRDDATLCLRLAVGYISSHTADLPDIELSPLYHPVAPATEEEPPVERFRNNKKGSKLFSLPAPKL